MSQETDTLEIQWSRPHREVVEELLLERPVWSCHTSFCEHASREWVPLPRILLNLRTLLQENIPDSSMPHFVSGSKAI